MKPVIVGMGEGKERKPPGHYSTRIRILIAIKIRKKIMQADD